MSRIFLFSLLFLSQSLFAQEQTFSKEQLAEDLTFFKAQLLKRHPNLFTYSSPEAFEQFFQTCQQELPQQATDLAFYEMISPISNLIKDGHTLLFPSENTMNYHNEQSLFFPFQVYWDGATLYTVQNCSEDEEIPDGSQILSINETASEALMDRIMDRMMHDGDNTTYPSWVINNWFREYYSFYFGHPTYYQITFKYPDGSLWKKTISGLTRKAIAKNKGSLYPRLVKANRDAKGPGKGITLTLIPEQQTAILTIKDFHNQTLKKVYQQSFKKAISQYFSEIKANNIQHLLLDLRNNQGGAIKNGKILLSYLMNSDFQMVEAYQKVDARKNLATSDRLKKAKGPMAGTHAPNANAFSGDLTVLVNGGSFSNSGIVSAALERYDRAIFIGTETGGSKNILAGNIKNIKLPNTQIQIQIPTLQFQINNADKKENYSGTIPDHVIQPGIMNLMDRQDVVLEFALDLVKQKK